jgi:hypothetical protein
MAKKRSPKSTSRTKTTSRKKRTTKKQAENINIKTSAADEVVAEKNAAAEKAAEKAAAEKAAAEKAAEEKAAAEKAAAEKAAAEKAAAEKAAAEKAAEEKAAEEKAAAEKAAAEKAAAEKAAAEKAAAEKAAEEKAAEEKAAEEKAAEEKAAEEKAAAEKAAAEKAAAEKAAAEKAAAEKAAAEKAAAEKAAAEKAAAEKAAAEKAAAEKAADDTEYESFSQIEVSEENGRRRGHIVEVLAVLALVAVVAVIVAASYSNRDKYYLKITDTAVEIWQGRFSPKGAKLLIILPGATPPKDVKTCYFRDEVFPLAFDYYISKADAISTSEKVPDFEVIKAYLNKARAYSTSQASDDLINSRLNSIDLLFLFYETDAVIRSGGADRLKTAKDRLEKVASLVLDPIQQALVKQKLDKVRFLLEDLTRKMEIKSEVSDQATQSEST